MKLTNSQLLMLIGAGVLGVWYLKKSAGDALNAVNPTNNDNIFYSGVNSVGGALSDDDNFSLGSWVYDVFNKDESL